MHLVTDALALFWALRWLLVFIAFAILGTLYAVEILENRELRNENSRLEDGNRRLRSRLHGRTDGKPGIVVGPVRS